MLWTDIRKAYPNKWLVIEAIKAHTTNNQRKLEKIAVIEVCQDGNTAMNRYRKLHTQMPGRELYFVHTSRTDLDIRERQWVGIRRGNAITVEG